MWPRVGTALALLCILASDARAQAVRTDTAPRVRTEVPVSKDGMPDTRDVAGKSLAQPAPYAVDYSFVAAFDTAQDLDTRRTFLAIVPALPDPALRRELIVHGLMLSGDRSASFVAALAALTALQLGNEGKAILRDALEKGLVRDERTLTIMQAALRGR